MSLQASKCYYHPESGAVATCAKCGVGVCEKCAVKYEGRILCYQCVNEYLKRDYREHRKWLKERGGRFRNGKDFIVPGIIGILIFAACVAVNYFSTGSPLFDRNWGINLLCAYACFSAPFCYIALGDFIFLKYSGLNLIIIILLFIFSFVFGWTIFTFILIRFVICKIISRNKSANQ